MLPQAEHTTASDAVDEDARMMAAALCFARRGLGRVAPNPAVGALVIKDGVVVGRGVTGVGGRPHAETIALREAGSAAKGAALYVTLEPCSHHGRTPPCADAIIAAGISRVVSATDDPDARVAGQGHQRLRAAGIDLRTGVLSREARRLNIGHILRVTQGRPMLTLKLAETVDGFAAGPAGAPRLMLTGETANAHVHMMRTLHDAVFVGSGTALADDPLLTVRLPGLEAAKPLRIVIDPKLAMPPASHLAMTAIEHPVLVLANERASHAAEAQLVEKGVEIIRLADGDADRLDLSLVLKSLAERGLTRVFCEGGPRLAASLIADSFADEIVLLTSTVALQGQGIAALSPSDRASLADPGQFRCVEDRMLGPDRLRRYERLL
ncbi:MAG: bifunctional diaminohydroxyphosphoribosylaminopyrimidine deaminase/5-amino-6-(5-phosphoribosylamino)uracil reductase RibD [Beijerinckiaceae bacterium]|nr:MAG: bifunctional diaminohydroxyphosphoribosylaminopyrimidine deaminase/5-amino-6-(5-phosphoribosylamino)uracil reductase RibD [Beijerinckiaceae bacterium]